MKRGPRTEPFSRETLNFVRLPAVIRLRLLCLRNRKGHTRRMDPPNENDPAGRWRTIQAALGSWSQTARLCLILITTSAPLDAIARLWH